MKATMMKLIKYTNQEKTLLVINEKAPYSLITRFIQDLMQSYIDTYMVVCYAINTLLEKQITLEQDKLTNELHATIKELYHMGCIPYLNSCLKEIINTAFSRFSELRLCDA